MEKTIALKIRTVIKTIGNQSWEEIQIKNGKRIEAVINPPNRLHPEEYMITKMGLAVFCFSLHGCFEYIRKNFEDRLNAFTIPGNSYKVTLEGSEVYSDSV